VSLKQHGRLEQEQFLHWLEGQPAGWRDKEEPEFSQEGTYAELEATLSHQDTNTSHGHTQIVLDGHSAPKPIHT